MCDERLATPDIVMSLASGLQRLPLIGSYKIEENYRLAQKLFQCRKFHQSLQVSKEVYQQALTSFQHDPQHEKTLVKAACLHMVIAGVLAKDGDCLYESISPDLKSEYIIDDLQTLYGSSQHLPLQVWYHYFLALAGSRAIKNGSASFILLESLITTVQEPGFNDAHYPKLVDLFVFEVLPSNDLFTKAQTVIKTHPQYHDNIDASITRLAQVKDKKRKNQKLQKDIRHQETLHERKNTMAPETKPSGMVSSSDQEQARLSDNRVVDASHGAIDGSSSKRLEYVIHLLKSYISQNGIWSIAVVAMALISGRVLKKGNFQIRKKLAETLKMAFQVSYI